MKHFQTVNRWGQRAKGKALSCGFLIVERPSALVNGKEVLDNLKQLKMPKGLEPDEVPPTMVSPPKEILVKSLTRPFIGYPDEGSFSGIG